MERDLSDASRWTGRVRPMNGSRIGSSAPRTGVRVANERALHCQVELGFGVAGGRKRASPRAQFRTGGAGSAPGRHSCWLTHLKTVVRAECVCGWHASERTQDLAELRVQIHRHHRTSVAFVHSGKARSKCTCGWSSGEHPMREAKAAAVHHEKAQLYSHVSQPARSLVIRIKP